MDYYIQGDPDRTKETKAAFERLGIDTDTNCISVGNDYYLYYSFNRTLYFVKFSDALLNVFKSNPVYKELELSFTKPKFKAGDWLVYNDGDTFCAGEKEVQVQRVGKDRYIFTQDSIGPHEFIDSHCRLWTIEDAKDGDVLSTDNGWTCIFKKFDGYVFSSYCFMDSQKWFCPVGSVAHTLDSRINGNIHPATKEQRDLLFIRMKEAGYTWDEKKKEMKKITVKPMFKVGDWLYHNKVGVYPVLITGYDENLGYETECLSTRTYFRQEFVEKEYHLWSIEDAKDGDVLACGDWLFILKQFNVKGNNHKTYCHYDLTLNRFKDDIDSYMVSGSDEYHPATKEQLDLLFHKMKEAGYQWNAEKKELRKIIEPTFKVGDEIYRPARNEYFEIKDIEKDNDTVWYVTTRTRISDNDKRVGEIVRVNAFYQNEYSIAPKPHYDISNFHAGMPVLVRDTDEPNERWQYVHFSNYYGGSFYACGSPWDECIPLNDDTKHLLGTTDTPDEMYINW